MRNIIFILTCFFLGKNVNAQIWFHHTIKQSKIQSYGFRLVTVTGNPPVTTNVNLCTDRSGVITVSGGQINVDLWQISDNTTCPNGIDSSTAITSLRIIDGRATYGRPTKVLVLPFKSINLGVNTLPFRFRRSVTQDGTNIKIAATGTTAFQLALNLGYTLGFSQITTRSVTNWSATLGGYFGPSTADLKKETVHNPSTWITNQTNASLTYGINLILARNNLGLVFAYGWENALGTNKKAWVYNGQPYFAFGINTGFMR